MTFRLTSGRKAVLRSLLDLARDQVIAAALPEPHDYPPAWGEDGTKRGADVEIERCAPQSVTLFTLHKRAERFDIEGDGNVFDCPTCKLDLDGSLLAVSSVDLAVDMLEHEASDQRGRDWTARIVELLEAALYQVPLRYRTTFWPPRKRAGCGQRPPLLSMLAQFFLALSTARAAGATDRDVAAAEAYFESMNEHVSEYLRAKAEAGSLELATRQEGDA